MLGVLPMLTFMHGPSWGQSVSIPSSADPARAQDRFDLLPHNRLNQDIKPPEMLAPDTDIPDAPDGFVMQDITLRGATIFSRDDLDFIIKDYIGRRVDLTVLNHLAARITAYYREKGYFLSRALIPQQEVNDNTVTVQIIEGYISQVIIDDPEDLLADNVLGTVRGTIDLIRGLQPLHGPTLERYMLILNEGTGVHTQSLMQADPNAARVGGVQLVLRPQAKDDAYRLSANNHGSRYIGPWQFQAAYQTGNVLSPTDNLSVQGVIARPLKEIQYGTVAYSAPIHANGLRTETSVSYSNSNPGSTLRALEVESDTFVFEGGVSYPYIRSRKSTLDLGAKFVLRNTATETLDSELIDDKTRAFVLSADYTAQDFYKGMNALGLSLHKGADFLGARKTGASDLSRAQGRSDFFKAMADVQRVQYLPQDFRLTAKANGQYAPHPLLSSEEFGYGGSDVGRAYDPSEITGDLGVSAATELTYAGLPAIADEMTLAPFIFYDIGKVWNHDRATKPVSGASAGFGTYYQFQTFPSSGSLSIAYPLTKDIDHPDMNGVNGPRVLFELTLQF